MTLKVIREAPSEELLFCDIARGSLFRAAANKSTGYLVYIKTGNDSFTQLTGGVDHFKDIGAGNWAVTLLEGTLTVKEKG